jgi:outer membrane protein OmpA-like peptidoglycan-associated protein
LGTFALGLALALAAVGCVTSGEVTKTTEELNEAVRGAKVPAYYCAPKDLALAEAHIEFARVESSLGNTIDAADHLELAKKHTAAVTAVKGQKGCCPDRDGDLLCDADDKCPDDPEDMDKDQDDDGCPEYDRDGDGIHDQNDRCPDQAEDKDKFLDEDGCPDEDNDGDGINEYPVKSDQCPDKPEVYNGLDDMDGCPDELPEAPPPPKEFKNIVVEDDRIVFKRQINFATNSAKIVGQLSEEILDEAAEALRTRTEVRVQIEGHTDERGPDKKNKKLSQARAESVVNAMVARGLARSRLVPVGFGEERPLDPGHTKEAWEKNRRVEFNFLQ